MGVPGLWTTLAVSAINETLTGLTVKPVHHGMQGFVLGIDMSIWFFQLQNTYSRGHPGSGQNPELRTLLYRLAKLLALPIRPVFVFDGPARPPVKRGTNVVNREHWMVQPMKAMIEAFGFQWWTAPGEAEAELAYMNETGRIDAVLTEDVDVFLFGAKTVIRNAHVKAGDDQVSIYTAASIEKATSMTRYGMILVGLLSGGDYGPGLRGFGQHISHGLARYGYGDTLCLAEQSLTPERFDTFLVQWREDLRQALLHDPAHHLGRSRPALAALVTDRFPGDTLALYLHPVTSRDTGVQPPAILRQAFRPSLSSLAVMCERYFGWDQCTIYDKFKKLVWPGHILRNMMMAATNLENVVQRRQIQDSATDRAVEYLAWIDSEANTTRGSYTTRTKFDIHWRKIIMPTKRLAIRTLDSIDDIGPQPASRIGSGTTDVIALWVPSYLFNDFDLLVSRVTSPVPDILEASRPVEHVAPAGQAGPSRILIDLTLSDDEDGPSTKGGHTGRVLPFVPGTDGIIDLT